MVNYDSNETTDVGKFFPNAFGLFDMYGNVWEWCQDNWHSNYIGAPNDGSSWVFGDSSEKLVRGGSWFNNLLGCRSANRNRYMRREISNTRGFRVVCVAP